MYSKFPKVSILTSKGIRLNNEVYFVIHYRIFRRPEGIMRFPDGGLPKDLINEYYIVKYQNSNEENKIIYKLCTNCLVMDLHFVDVSKYNNKVYLLIKFINKDNEKEEKMYVINPQTNETVVKTKKFVFPESVDNQDIISIKSTNEFVRFIYDYDKLGLKNPLDFMNLSDKNIKKVLLYDKLNGRMQVALIYYMIKNNKTKLLEEIEKENTNKYIAADIRYFKEGWSIKQLKEYYKSIK